MDASPAPPVRRRRPFALTQNIILVLTSVAAFAALVLPLASRPAALPLSAGEVAPRDLQAPRAAEYVSEVRTEEARLAAERAVPPVYAPADPAIARAQIERLRAALQYITLVRQDEFATPEQKAADLTRLSDVQLPPSTIQAILELTPARWDALQQEALSVLERVMRNTIRTDDLDTFRRSVPSLVSLALNEQQAGIVAELVTSFVVPNSIYSAELTDAARLAARDTVAPVVQTYKSGETIVQGGEIITPAQIEALEILGMISPGQQASDYLGAAVLTAVCALFVWLYAFRKQPAFITSPRSMILIALLLLLFLIGARLSVPNRTVMPYLYPLPAFAMLITALFGLEAGLVLSLVISVLAAYGLANTLDLTPYYLFASLVGVLTLGPARRITAFARAAAAAALAGAAMVAAYRLPFESMDWIGIATLVGAALINGVASASIALLAQFFLAQLLGVTTALQLLEISRSDHPLLQHFLRSAPGTYQHSLQVANLAEQAAERIGADALLTRVGALYHDVGKSANAGFFIENQAPGNIDTHKDMQPSDAAANIIRHVTDGLTMARRHRLPPRIHDFMSEHHGTLIAWYQYKQALEAAGNDASKVDVNEYRYPGPAPRSRETAILMLADRVEARARAERPQNEEALRALVRSVIDQVQQERQLDQTPLTLRDLALIVDSFTTTLRGTYHPRITYPKREPVPAPEAETRPSPRAGKK